MKLKRLLAGILTGALMITGIPVLGLEKAASVPVYAEEPVEGTGEDEDVKFPNVAKGKEVRSSGVNTATTDVAANVVDDDEDTKWTSVDLRQMSPQWLEIDLEAPTIDIDKIEIVYGDEIWAGNYTISTYDAEKNATWHTVKTVGTNGPDLSIGDDEDNREKRDAETKTDTILRNSTSDLITLSRYVRFNFTLPTGSTGTDEKSVSIAEIRIYGSEGTAVYGPEIDLTAPVTGKLPKVAEVLLPDGQTGVHHTILTDLTYPATTLIRQNTGTRSKEKHTIANTTTEVDVYRWTDGAPVVLADDEIFLQGGKYGFNAPVQTRSVSNKFDVLGADLKIISCQVYFKNKPTSGTVDLFGHSDKMAVQMDKDKLYAYMEVTPSFWPEQDLVFGQNGVPRWDELVNNWHDLLYVVDGKGKQRIYLDGICGTTSRSDEGAVPREEPGKGLQPFTLGFNYAASDGKDDLLNDFDNQLTKINNKAFTKDYGYLSRFDFYTSQNYHKFPDPENEGTDISDAATLSTAFMSAFDEEKGLITDLEDRNSKNDVSTIITNMLQQEPQTGRISICPYKFNTVWSKKTDTGWETLGAEEKFADGTKYKATVTLQADSGFLFDLNSAINIQNSWDLGADDAVASIQIKNKRREIVVTAYYNCDNSDVDETCHIDNLVVGADPLRLVAGADPVSIGADVTSYTKCGTHQAQTTTIKFEYELSDDLDGTIILDKENGTIKATKSTREVIGYKPITLTVKAQLVDQDGNVLMSTSGATPTPVEYERTDPVEIEVDPDPTTETVQTITAAPSITAQSPVVGKFPQVVDIALPEDTQHFDYITDRTNPGAGLDQLTTSYIKNSNYIKQGASANGRPVQPNDAWFQTWETDDKYKSVIDNVDGVIGFNAIGQTSGDTNKFDVFGSEIKLVSFKLYLKKWPENP